MDQDFETVSFIAEESDCTNLGKVKFIFSKKATKIDEIFTVDLTVTAYCLIDGEDFVIFCGLLRKREPYICAPHMFSR